MSQAIVDFIGHLLPLYVEEHIDDRRCARSLQDGTLIFASADPEDEFVTVHWQGDPARQSSVQAVFIASLAVARYVELRHIAENGKDTRQEMARVSEHFIYKTGKSLTFETSDSGLVDALFAAAGRLGEQAVMDLLKKAAGF